LYLQWGALVSNPDDTGDDERKYQSREEEDLTTRHTQKSKHNPLDTASGD
jgi:hypothetical protein